MPKLIDYPRTTYAGAWELSEVIDDTGGKCTIEMAARKLNRKVSGSFKAIIGSAVKFGLMTSKRDLLTTTTLFKRIKHAYDKQEELVFHREAFLTPPLFTQLCRKFRSRELPVQMLDVMLIREFAVEEINAQGVAKAFVEGCRMVGLLDEHNIIADIDALSAQQKPRRELSSPVPVANTFRNESTGSIESHNQQVPPSAPQPEPSIAEDPFHTPAYTNPKPVTRASSLGTGQDAVASLFGLLGNIEDQTVYNAHATEQKAVGTTSTDNHHQPEPAISKTTPRPEPTPNTRTEPMQPVAYTSYQLQVTGPGINTTLSILDEDDITIAIALLEKVRRQLKS